jgi:chemotaxis signal transduction protein
VSASALDQAGTLACLFEVGGRVFAVEIKQAREVRAFDHYTVVPLGSPHLIGMTSLRGAIIPIVDLLLLLGLPPGAGTGQSLVVEARGVRVAIAVDRVLGVEALEEGAEPVLGGGAVEFERGRLRRGDVTIPIIDVARIVDSLSRGGAPAFVETPIVAREGER